MFGVLIPSPLPKAKEWEVKNGVPSGTISKAIQTGGDGNSWKKYMRGEIGPVEFMKAFSQDCSQISGFKVHIGSFHLALSSDSQPVRVMMEAVKCARAEGYKTAVLTNNFLLDGGKSFLPLDSSLFDVIVESCKVGLSKPDLRIFQLCAERLEVSPQEAVFLDDLSFNVEAAVKAGMHGILVKDPAFAVKELEQVLKVSLSETFPETISVRLSSQLPMNQLTQYLNKAIQLPYTENITMHYNHCHLQESTYLLSCGEQRFILKKIINNAALTKECRLLKALKEAGVPVPDVKAQSEMPSVLNSPFYVTSYCDGRVFDPMLSGVIPDKKRCVYETMIKTLCQIHSVDLKTTGLEDLIKSGDFMESEVKKLAKQLKALEVQPLPVMDRLIEWLLLHLPKQQRMTFLHGNFSLNKLVFDSETLDVKAVLGWSCSTVGDPLVDVASCCIPFYWTPSSEQQGNKLDLMGIPNTQEIFELYSKTMGLENIPNWQFYMAFCLFQQAAMLQTNHTTFLKGIASKSHIEHLLKQAWDFATMEGFRIFNALPKAAST
ncbi:acyl-CoA dehydrogenase family member 10-like [Trichomycterus rosablanca]|uniref:acyl-CoA dehydrogenase family member 10-like n=1 Tax=Trichomycterus rosablanca TaxID=2290929 RepID=UPI002F35934A